MNRMPDPDEPPALTGRRRLLQAGGALMLLSGAQLARGDGIVAVRVWPAEDYTRVTIEADRPLNARYRLIGSPPPPRLAVDVDDLQLDGTLRELVAKVQSNDPNIAGVRVGQYAPDIVRLVLDLKHPIKPEVFTLKPVAPYRHRLIFDLYPANPPDPLTALIAERMKDLGTKPPAAGGESQADALGELIARQIERASGTATRPDETVARAPEGPAPGPGPEAVATAPAAPSATHGKVAARSDTSRLIIVAIDAGHGGEDPGAIGPGGTREKDVVLQIAFRLRDRINASNVGGNPMRAYLTRDADFFVPLATRVQKARRVQADLFVSIHADSFIRPDASGASVYALSERGATSTAARWLANNENQSDLIGGVNVTAHDAVIQQALLDMSTTAQIRDSMKLGSVMLSDIQSVAQLHKNNVERANFAVLRNPDVPSVLVETAFISNPGEERKLRSAAYQNQLADALVNGIRRYFAANPPLARNRQV